MFTPSSFTRSLFGLAKASRMTYTSTSKPISTTQLSDWMTTPARLSYAMTWFTAFVKKMHGFEFASLATAPARCPTVWCDSRRMMPFASLSACTNRMRSSGCDLYVLDFHSPYSCHRSVGSYCRTMFQTSTVQTALPRMSGRDGRKYRRMILNQKRMTECSGSGVPTCFFVVGSNVH